MTEHNDVVVVGAGHAGLAVSHELTQAGVSHVVLEKGQIGLSWRGLWDSFCLMTPNWNVRLPGLRCDEHDPDAFMHRDDVVAFLERYAARFHAPVSEGVDVTGLHAATGGGLLLETSAGEIAARTVVVCSGAYQRPWRPAAASALPAHPLQIDACDYRDPSGLPAGAVLVVGSGQSGCQIAEECCEAGRDVFVACGRAPWVSRRIGDHDAIWWAVETGFFDAPLSSLPSPAARFGANVQSTGSNGGHDLHYRTLQAIGVTLLGHFTGVDGHRARFAPDLAQTVDWADQRHDELMGLVRKVAAERGLAAPEISEPEPFSADPPDDVDLDAFGAVIFATGFRPDYASWVHIPGAFDEYGFPVHHEGASTVAEGLYFLGVHFLRKRKSALFIGACEDAPIVARQVIARETSLA
ncbi:MAG: putative flavoprotein involved in transport [bacterium]|jgi:putative flavoprotein involved in K+ transport